MQKFRRFIALGLVAAIAAIGPPVTAQAEENTDNVMITKAEPFTGSVVNVAAPIHIENVLLVVATPVGLDTIGLITVELVVIDSPPAQIAEAPEPLNSLSAAYTALMQTVVLPDAHAKSASLPARTAADTMPIEPTPTARDALWRSSMPTFDITGMNSPTSSTVTVAALSGSPGDRLPHLNL